MPFRRVPQPVAKRLLRGLSEQGKALGTAWEFVMFNLTQQERIVLLFIAGVILVGSLLQIVSKQSTQVRDFLQFMEQSEP